jgi:uncharacterized RDD family membrane protein YckC
MKCPKCEYLGFETSDRCRNCGYEFSLAQSADPHFDLSLALGDSEPLIPSPDAQAHMRQFLDLDRIIGGPHEAAEDLPLFPTPSRPRAPLGVRRATPEILRARIKTPRPHEETLFEAPPAALGYASAGARAAAAPEMAATAGSRILAALVDGAILLGLDAAVIYFTLRLCNLTAGEVLELPVIPLMAFVLLLNGGYFVAFTAVGGQSIGKMAVGIKVVSDEDRPVPFGRATLRTLAYIVSALPFGAGFLPGVVGADRLALHDRLAHTRVVRPSSI